MKLDQQLFSRLLEEAEQNERKRAHHMLHKHFDEPVQRLCIALKQGTYIRPHHHPQGNKWELLLGLSGRVGLVVFDAEGVILEKEVLAPGSVLCAVELAANTWHCIYPETQNAVIMEVKEGPYLPAKEADFAAWAPQEGAPESKDFLTWLEHAEVGDSYRQ